MVNRKGKKKSDWDDHLSGVLILVDPKSKICMEASFSFTVRFWCVTSLFPFSEYGMIFPGKMVGGL